MYENTTLQEYLRNRDKVDMFLMNGFKLRGTIYAFDKDVVIFMDEKKQKHMVYKHAISTITKPQVEQTPTAKIPY